MKTYGKQIQDDSGVGRKSGSRVEVEPPSRKKVRVVAKFQDQQYQGATSDQIEVLRMASDRILQIPLSTPGPMGHSPHCRRPCQIASRIH